MISVVIPVGPRPIHQTWLPECLASVAVQTLRPTDVVIVDDMADLATEQLEPLGGIPARIVRNAWRLGVGSSLNCGVALAANELVFLLAADDWLEPDCLESCVAEWQARADPIGYYHVTVRYRVEPGYVPAVELPPGGLQDLPCGAAMVTKKLFRHTGGFPVESGSGSPDAALISILIGQKGEAGNLYHVRQGTPLYNVRFHLGQESGMVGPWWNVIIQTRDLVTKLWQSPDWNRS